MWGHCIRTKSLGVDEDWPSTWPRADVAPLCRELCRSQPVCSTAPCPRTRSCRPNHNGSTGKDINLTFTLVWMVVWCVNKMWLWRFWNKPRARWQRPFGAFLRCVQRWFSSKSLVFKAWMWVFRVYWQAHLVTELAGASRLIRKTKSQVKFFLINWILDWAGRLALQRYELRKELFCGNSDWAYLNKAGPTCISKIFPVSNGLIALTPCDMMYSIPEATCSAKTVRSLKVRGSMPPLVPGEEPFLDLWDLSSSSKVPFVMNSSTMTEGPAKEKRRKLHVLFARKKTAWLLRLLLACTFATFCSRLLFSREDVHLQKGVFRKLSLFWNLRRQIPFLPWYRQTAFCLSPALVQHPSILTMCWWGRMFFIRAMSLNMNFFSSLVASTAWKMEMKRKSLNTTGWSHCQDKTGKERFAVQKRHDLGQHLVKQCLFWHSVDRSNDRVCIW